MIIMVLSVAISTPYGSLNSHNVKNPENERQRKLHNLLICNSLFLCGMYASCLL